MAVAIDQHGADVELLELLGATPDGMVAVAPGGAILGWNDGAAALLEFGEDEVVGRPCYEVLDWLDRCGNRVCSAFCSTCRPTGGDELVATRDVICRSKSGRTVWLSVSTLVPPPTLRSRCGVVHLFREVGLPPELERLLAGRLQPARDPVDDGDAASLAALTPREREILALLADGADTAEIARRLVVSVATVRNHVQNILGKLGVHSRLEATVRWLRSGAGANA